MAGAFAELGFCSAWSLPRGGQAEVVSARLNPRNSTVEVGGMCNFLGPVSTAKIWSNGWTRVKALWYSSVLFRKQRKIHPRGMRAGRPKRREERRNFQVNFGSFLYMFFLLPLSMPYINWASQQGCLFYQKFSLRSSDLPLFYFYGLFPLSFSHHCFGLLFPVLTTQQYQVQNFFDNLSSVFAWFNYFGSNNLCALLLRYSLTKQLDSSYSWKNN